MKIKKIVIISIIMVALFSSSVSALDFYDVKIDDWFYEDIMMLTQGEIINGFEDGTFRPNDNISVDQFVKLIIKSLGYDIANGVNYWALPYIDKARELNILFEGEFNNYTRPITRGEMARLIIRGMNKTYKNDIYEFSFYMNDYFLHEDINVLKAFYSGIITGYPDGNFYPDKNATRAEASTMLMRMLVENRRIDTNYLAKKENEMNELEEYYLDLEKTYMDRYNAGFDYEPYVFDNGDMSYDSNEGNFEVYIWNNGDIYIGAKLSDITKGFGIYLWPDGSKYAGDWEANMRNGFGNFTWSDGDKYSGEWQYNKRTGFGIETWIDSGKYIGQFMDGNRNGLGKLKFADGSSYIGNFENNYRTGIGILEYVDGLSYFGDFKENELARKNFTMYYKDSTTNEFAVKIDQIINTVITISMTTNDKIKAIHDYLILNVRYDTENYNKGTISDRSHSSYGALVDGVSVCSGYSEAFNALLNELDIDSYIAGGVANGGAHAWNYVQFEEGYYYVDVTWDDYDDGVLRYDYYQLTEDQIDDDHIIEYIIN